MVFFLTKFMIMMTLPLIEENGLKYFWKLKYVYYFQLDFEKFMCGQ